MKPFQNIFLTIFLISSLMLVNSCGGKQDSLAQKKSVFMENRKKIQQLQADNMILGKEIQAKDPNFKLTNEEFTLVSTLDIQKQNFQSFLEVQGNVESDQNVLLSAETGGVVRAISVKEGQFVNQGQLLVAQGSSVVSNQINEVKTRIKLAKTVFEKREKLWEQNIGTEIQYLEAKNNVESLEAQLATLQAQVGLSNTYAPFSGVVDEIIIRPGQNAGPGSPLLRLVSSNPLNVVAEISESYLGRIQEGDMVKILFPNLNNKEIEAPVSLVSAVINPENRTFRVEIAINNADRDLKPDLLATVKLQDYSSNENIVIPSNLIQRDKVGDFVFILAKKGKKSYAKKTRVKRGLSYDNQTEITSGLKGQEKLINKGFRDIVDGEFVKVQETKTAKKIAKAKS